MRGWIRNCDLLHNRRLFYAHEYPRFPVTIARQLPIFILPGAIAHRSIVAVTTALLRAEQECIGTLPAGLPECLGPSFKRLDEWLSHKGDRSSLGDLRPLRSSDVEIAEHRDQFTHRGR